jgi:Spy/CpxP family protein refolding chaperone
MNKTQAVTLTLIAMLSAGAFLDAGSVLAQQADPGSTQTPAPWPCPRGGMGRGGWYGAGDRTQAHLERMAWRLNLTEEQKAKLEPILRQRDETRAARRQAMRNEIAAILTPDQVAQFDRMGPVPVRTAPPTGGTAPVQP